MSLQGSPDFGRSQPAAAPPFKPTWRWISNTSKNGACGWTCEFSLRRSQWFFKGPVCDRSVEGMSTLSVDRLRAAGSTGEFAAHVVLAPIQALLAAPTTLFLVAFTVFLFRPPDLDFYSIDRIAFCLLMFVVFLRVSTLRQSLSTWGGLA